MGKKKAQDPPAALKHVGKRFNPVLMGAAIVVLVGVSVLAFWRGADQPAAAPATAPAAVLATTQRTAGAADQSQPSPEPDARAIARAEAAARLGPHKQATLPPIPFQGYAPPRPPEVVTAAYRFAAEHPEILSYIPCFCGCERAGHGGNADCFVRQRAENGDVIAWSEHGVECTVCIDVANRSRQMHASGASVRDIRAAIDKEFSALYPGRMATPHPPAHVH